LATKMFRYQVMVWSIIASRVPYACRILIVCVRVNQYPSISPYWLLGDQYRLASITDHRLPHKTNKTNTKKHHGGKMDSTNSRMRFFL